MKKYKSTCIVTPWVIEKITNTNLFVEIKLKEYHTGDNASYHYVRGHQAEDYIKKYQPKVGAILTEYPGGCLGYRTREAFENHYIPVDDSSLPPLTRDGKPMPALDTQRQPRKLFKVRLRKRLIDLYVVATSMRIAIRAVSKENKPDDILEMSEVSNEIIVS